MEQPVGVNLVENFSIAEIKLIYRCIRRHQQDLHRRMSDDTALQEPDMNALQKEDLTCDFILAKIDELEL